MRPCFYGYCPYVGRHTVSWRRGNKRRFAGRACPHHVQVLRWAARAVAAHYRGYQAGLEHAAQLVCPTPHVEEERTCADVAEAIRARKTLRSRS